MSTLGHVLGPTAGGEGLEDIVPEQVVSSPDSRAVQIRVVDRVVDRSGGVVLESAVRMRDVDRSVDRVVDRPGWCRPRVCGTDAGRGQVR